MSNGLGQGRGPGRGRGLGFRGTSPPEPYVGLGRGGLARCVYPGSGAGVARSGRVQATAYSQDAAVPENPPRPAQRVSKEEELDGLRKQAGEARQALDKIEARMRDLES